MFYNGQIPRRMATKRLAHKSSAEPSLGRRNGENCPSAPFEMVLEQREVRQIALEKS